MAITLPALPFAPEALEPIMSATTLGFHHGKHHKAYVDKTNELIAGTELENASLVEIVRKAFATKNQALFRQAAQVWNHTFFWHSLTGDKTAPSADLAKAIDASFGSLDAFKEAFVTAAMGQFGSGWVWLVQDAEGLKTIKTRNAMTPLVLNAKPLLTVDVWEHAYYLDFQNNRKGFVEAILNERLNWTFASANFSAGIAQAA